MCLSGNWRTPRTKATIAVCAQQQHKGVRQRQVVHKDHHFPSAATVMTANYGEGWDGTRRGRGEETFFLKEKPFIKSTAGTAGTVPCLCVCLFGLEDFK